MTTSSTIKEWEYEYLITLCREHQEHYINVISYNGNKSIRLSAWLRIMGLMETWDMTC